MGVCDAEARIRVEHGPVDLDEIVLSGDSTDSNGDFTLTIEETIRIHTINGAWTLRLDDVTGSIAKGKSADMIVLNHNLLEVPATDIHKTEVQKTIFKGAAVHSAN